MLEILLENVVTAKSYIKRVCWTRSLGFLGETTPFLIFCEKETNETMEKNKDFHESKIRDSRALGATSRVVLH